jgi:hypothetical protein
MASGFLLLNIYCESVRDYCCKCEHLFLLVSSLFALALLYDSTGSVGVDSLARSGNVGFRGDIVCWNLFLPVSSLFALALLYDSTGSVGVDSLARSGNVGVCEFKFCWNCCS